MIFSIFFDERKIKFIILFQISDEVFFGEIFNKSYLLKIIL